MKCPACRTQPLKPAKDEHTGLEVDYCEKCNGLWFDAEELTDFLQSETLMDRFFCAGAVLPEHAVPDEAPRVCPRDGTEMTKRDFARVMLDRCPTCRGNWFDGGELREVVDIYRVVNEKNRPKRPPDSVMISLKKGMPADGLSSSEDKPLPDEALHAMDRGVLSVVGWWLRRVASTVTGKHKDA